MTTLLDHLDSRTSESVTDIPITPAQRLRSTMAAVRVSFTWFGVQKTLTREQKAQAAEAFDADGPFLSAGKKLIDTRHAAFRAVTAIRGQVDAAWKGQSLPYPEPGVRLIRHDSVEGFAAQMTDFRVELDDAVANLDRHYGELKQAARDRLGSLYNPADYPETLIGLFGMAWDFPNVEPPDYLVQLSPGLYEAERARVASRFEEAVQLAEQAFLDEFTKLVAHLSERISGLGDDGQPKVFRDSAMGNLVAFFDRFRTFPRPLMTPQPIVPTEPPVSKNPPPGPIADPTSTGLVALIREAESLHEALGLARSRSQKLVVALRRQRKQARLMAATLNTLRQLKLQEVAG
jgi:hypothetical protein